MQEGCAKDAKVEYLVASSTEVKLARWTPLGAPDHVNDGSLDVDIAADGVHRTRVRSDVGVHEREHYEHRPCWKAKYDVHDSPYFLVLRLVKLRNQSHDEARKAAQTEYAHVNVLRD